MYNNQNFLKELFNITIPNENLEGGQFIENHKIYKKINEITQEYKPKVADSIEMYCFELAIKMASLEFYENENHGFYNAETYIKYFDYKFQYINVKELVGFCYFYSVLNEFKESNFKCDYEKSLVFNKVTNEVISFENFQTITQKIICCELNNQINIIKVALRNSIQKNELINIIAGSEKEDYVGSAILLFNNITEI